MGMGWSTPSARAETASKNYHIMLLVADIIWQILADGVLVRLKRLARKLTDIGFVRLMFAAFLYVPISRILTPSGRSASPLASDTRAVSSSSPYPFIASV